MAHKNERQNMSARAGVSSAQKIHLAAVVGGLAFLAGCAVSCTSYEGCSPGHPVRWCAFDGSNGHDPSPKDPGQSMTWNPVEAWKFFTQF
jgi:hypothetical protein